MNGILGLFEQRIRGIRLVELVGILLCLGTMFGLGWIKMHEDSDVKRLEALKRDIEAEAAQLKTLRATVAQLEQPKRIEALASVYLGMKPVDARHEANLDSLVEISRSRTAGARGIDPVKASPVPPMPVPVAEEATSAPVEADAVQTGEVGQ